jgi:hypothetical protein
MNLEVKDFKYADEDRIYTKPSPRGGAANNLGANLLAINEDKDESIDEPEYKT